MAKKKQDIELPVASTLVKSREEVKSLGHMAMIL